MVNLSFTTMATYDWNGIESIIAARKFGYQGVDLRVSDRFGEITLDWTRNEMNELKNAFDSEGIKASGLLCYNKSGNLNKNSWGDMEDSVLRHLEIANELSSPSIRIFINNPENYGDEDVYLKKTAETLQKVLDKDKSNIMILIQHHSKKCTFWKAVDLIHRVNSKRFRMVFSPDHCFISEMEMEKVLKAAKGISAQLYVADINKVIDNYETVLPGKGSVPYKEIYESLEKESFRGWVTFKWERIWHRELEGAEIALPHFIKYIKNFINN